MPDELLDLLRRVVHACVFKAVGRDDEHRAHGTILFSRILVNVADVLDRVADGVEKRRAAAREVFAPRQWRNLPDGHAVVNDLDFVVKEHGGNEDVRAFFLLAAQHAVEAADSVRFQARHRAAAVKDEYEFRPALRCFLFFRHDEHLLFAAMVFSSMKS